MVVSVESSSHCCHSKHFRITNAVRHVLSCQDIVFSTAAYVRFDFSSWFHDILTWLFGSQSLTIVFIRILRAFYCNAVDDFHRITDIPLVFFSYYINNVDHYRS